MKNGALLRYSLLAGCVYFILMSIAHFFGIKVPVLFVYYDVPYYAYQDMVISFAVLAYVGLFYLASKSRENVPVALLVLALTVGGLSLVNMSAELKLLTLLKPRDTYWIQTVIIGVYWVYLVILYIRDRQR
tara:strand:- start:611 stop:1003 length:393 start_codon:yes stop_codon:yes gene_type:complete